MIWRGYEFKIKEVMRVVVGLYLECLEFKEIFLVLIEKVEEVVILKSFILIEEILFIIWRILLIMMVVCQFLMEINVLFKIFFF